MKKNDLAAYSYDNDLNFYFNAGRVQNIDLVFFTFDYFETGERKGVFKPLEFLNFLTKQYDLLFENLEKPIDYINSLKEIPLTALQQHILFGFLLKWFGGYPVSENPNIVRSKQQESILRLVERAFLKYPGETPEKKYCQKDWIEYQRREQLTKMINELLSPQIHEQEAPALKLKWLGTPSQFGFIIDLLIQGGYLEKPTSSFPKDAERYLQIFDIETTINTLAKELSENTNNLSLQNRKKITIPHKSKLS